MKEQILEKLVVHHQHRRSQGDDFSPWPRQRTDRSAEGIALTVRNRRLLGKRFSSIRMGLIVAVIGLNLGLGNHAPSWACAVQDDVNDGDFEKVTFNIYRPVDHEVFPAATRAVSIIGTKPLGPTGLLRIQDPMGNLAEIHYSAIRTFFNTVLDNGGVPLPAGEWEATLCDGLEPLRAKHHIHFVIKEGEPPQAFPTIDVPCDHEVYPGNLPFIDFIGVASPDSTVWLRIYRVSTQEKILEIEVEGTIGFMWGYALMWGHGPGKYLAGVSPTSSDVSDYLSDSTTFEILERGEDDWPYLMPFKFLW